MRRILGPLILFVLFSLAGTTVSIFLDRSIPAEERGGPSRAEQAEYDPTRIDEIVAELREDPFYTDDYSAGELTPQQEAALRAGIDEQEMPVYVVMLTTSDLDESSGELRIAAGRILTQLGEGALIAQDGTRATIVGNGYVISAGYTDHFTGDDTYDGLRSALRSLQTEPPERNPAWAPETWEEPYEEESMSGPMIFGYPLGKAAVGALLGGMAGAFLGLPLGYFVKVVRRFSGKGVG